MDVEGSNPFSRSLKAQVIPGTTLLEKDYEIVTGGVPGDSQPCFGDSGGPLVRRIDRQNVTFGVVSAGVGSVDSICDVGSIYSSLGPDALGFIAKAKEWVDPCGDLGSTGVCAGSVARRCTNVAEGRRRIVEFDCASLDLACNTAAGQVACGDNVLGPPSRPPAPRARRRTSASWPH